MEEVNNGEDPSSGQRMEETEKSDDTRNTNTKMSDSGSPPSPKVRKPNRRSSVAIARRMSRASTAAVGISLEDQLSLVPGKGETSDLERFKQVLNICVRNTCRTIEREEADEGDLEDETSSISRLLVDECILPDSKIQEFVNILARTELKVQPEELLSSKVRSIRDYTGKLEAEEKEWRRFLQERNKLYKLGLSNLNQAEQGNIKVDETQWFNLSGEDKKFIRSLPDLTVAMRSVQKHQERQSLAAARMCREAVKLRGVLKRVEDDLDAAYKELELEPELAVNQDTKHILQKNSDIEAMNPLE